MHKCHLCDQSQKEGLYIYNLYICNSCEQEMLKTQPEDPNYQFFVNKLRRIRQHLINS
ncbi:Inhibitor of sigma-G Gin [Amphibacillus marinus]|uniref:Inhibitor of sigma-G Gin n=1 Tax=Amphibacillus marinus TaxID=872970 RepID=A0A1H8PCA1_9BACI|nr:sigma factor G inhibitor Gin [Amphibacillus marinus]SEO39163.1 Inhibitor of sigma-G Gin [Amphibacillus marinus]